MNRLLTSLSSLSLCSASLLFGGCTAKSLDTFEGEPVVVSEDYAPGQNVTIDGLYGDIFVTGGGSGKVLTTFKPFVYDGYDEEDEARAAIENNLDLSVDTVDGTTTISTDRHDATNGLGSHITVELPEEFDGVLIVKNAGDGAINQGHIDVSFVGDATTLNVVNHGLENCNILRGDDDDVSVVPNYLTNIDVRCEADITVRGARDNVFVKSVDPAFHSHVRVEIVDISESATGGAISGDNSSIEVIFPDEGDYNVMAGAAGPGGHLNELEPGSCEETTDDNSVDLICGAGGPIYQVEATDSDADDDENAGINIIVH